MPERDAQPKPEGSAVSRKPVMELEITHPPPPEGQSDRRLISPVVAKAVMTGMDKGLSGAWSLVGQATAMTIICVVFVWQVREGFAQAKYDRELFRDEVRAVREHNDKRYDRLAESIDRHAQAVAEQTRRLDEALRSIERTQRAIEAAQKSFKKHLDPDGPESRERAPWPRPHGCAVSGPPGPVTRRPA